jgi:hypothetical protein
MAAGNTPPEISLVSPRMRMRPTAPPPPPPLASFVLLPSSLVPTRGGTMVSWSMRLE